MDKMPDDVIRFAQLMQEVNQKWGSQMWQNVISGADNAAIREILKKHKLDVSEFDKLRLEILEKHVQALRSLPH